MASSFIPMANRLRPVHLGTLAGLLVLAFCATTAAENGDEDLAAPRPSSRAGVVNRGARRGGAVRVETVAAQPDAAQPERRSLPEVVVEPPAQPAPSAPAPAPATPSLFDVYPLMSDLAFGSGTGPFTGGTGVFRSEGSVFDSAGAVSVVTRQTIEEKQAPDIFHALQNEVGIHMQRTAAGQASPYIRGLTGQQILMLVDGIRMNNSIYRFGPNQYFNTIDIGMVDHIEVLRGPGSVWWGSDAMGGVINVVSRSPDVHWGMYHGDYSGLEFTQYYNTADSSPYSRVNVEGWVGNGGIFTGGSFLNVRDLDTGYDDFPRQPGTNYQQWAGDIKMNYLLSDSEMLTFAFQHFQQDDVPRSDRYPGYPGDRNNSNTFSGARFFDPQQRDLAYLRYQSIDRWGWDAVVLTVSYHRQRENQRRGVPETRFQETDVHTYGASLVAVRDGGAWGKWTFGADWYFDSIDSRYGGTASGPIIPDDASYERFGAFATWDVALTSDLWALAGTRYENIEASGTPVVDGNPIYINPNYHDWTTHVGLVYVLAPEVHLVGSVSQGFRAPNLDELMANNPNVLQQGQDLPSLGLLPERSVNYEIGFKTDFDRLRTQTFVFWTDLKNNIVPISAGPDQFKRANQDSYVQGVEFAGEWLWRDGWSVYGNFWYTYGRNRVTDGPLSRIPPMQGIAGIRWRHPETRAYFALYTWMARRQDRLDPVRDVTDERIPIGGTPGFATLNVRMGRRFGDDGRHRVSLSVENLTDQPYLVHGSGVYGTGVTARIGYMLVR